MIRNPLYYFLIPILLVLGLQFVAQSEAKADPCVGTWTIGISGLGDNASMNFWGKVDQPVGYNSFDARDGLRELDRLFWHHRNVCPGDHIKMIGHSQGAGLLHVWVTEHQWVENANAVLLADTKRFFPGLGGPGLSYNLGFMGYPMAGVDSWFGDFPVLSVCRWDDWVCNLDAPWGQSHLTGSHGWYEFNAHAYSNDARGPVMI